MTKMIEIPHSDFGEFLKSFRVDDDPIKVFCFNVVKSCCQPNRPDDHFVLHLYVDVWPNPEGVVIVTSGVEDGIELNLTIWAKNGAEVTNYLEAIDRQLQLGCRSFRFWGPEETVTLVKDQFSPKGTVDIHPLPFDFLLLKENFFATLLAETVTAPEGFKFDQLHPDEAELVDSLWKFRGPGSVEQTRAKLKWFPSVCLRDSEGLAVSFCLTHQLGVFNHGYTVAERRGRGLIVPVYKRLGQIHLRRGLHPCAFVELGNLASLKVFVDKLGWTNTNLKFVDVRFQPNPVKAE